MEFKGKTRTEQILTVMHILAWVAFVGFLIEAGTILTAYGVSIISPLTAENLPKAESLSRLREYNVWHYTLSMSFLVALPIMKSLVSFYVIKTLSKFNLDNPFTKEVSIRLEMVSHLAFGTWVVAMASNLHMFSLQKATGELHGNWVSGEFIFMVGLVYVVSQVFKRGVEIQSENEFTV
jgi:hypothetical protein